MAGRLGTGTPRKKGRCSMEIWERKDSGTRIRISPRFVGRHATVSTSPRLMEKKGEMGAIARRET